MKIKSPYLWINALTYQIWLQKILIEDKFIMKNAKDKSDLRNILIIIDESRRNVKVKENSINAGHVSQNRYCKKS